MLGFFLTKVLNGLQVCPADCVELVSRRATQFIIWPLNFTWQEMKGGTGTELIQTVVSLDNLYFCVLITVGTAIPTSNMFKTCYGL